MALRPAAVAGTWYPGSAARLAADVRGHLESAARESADAVPTDAALVALIAPHAGLRYSGPVAAHGYSLLQRHALDTIVLVGPSHYVGFEGASIWPRGAFETPLGNIPIDEEVATALMAACPGIADLPDAHRREHSLEMQLPFLATLARQKAIVPIVMGFQTRETAYALADGIAAVARGRRVLLIASSDLSHFYDAHTASALDHEVISRVEALDDEGLMALLERRADHACGGGPMVTVLRAARALGATTSRVLRYADSGDVSGDKSSVVGYIAAAIWR
ncbi:MAG TPA: AmmeMemoRadiSam system protein B [Vicinamibacterales bacterium]|nr:AmmeMemoRadiSam system protein B [Vicinamibacterales bacterium]